MDDTATAGSTTTATRGGDAPARRRPTATEAFRAQVALVFRRRGSLAGLALLVATPMTVISASAGGGASLVVSDLVRESWTLPTLLAVFWPVMVAWRDDTPSERAYHWTLPMGRTRLQLLRAAAGWAHLVAGLAAGIALAWTAGAAIRGGMAAGRVEVLAAVVPAATVLYLVGTLSALTTDRPVLWLVAAYLTVAGLEFLAGFHGWDGLVTVLADVFGSGPLSLSAAGVLPQAVSGELGGSSVTSSPWRAAGLWLAVTAGLTVAAARLHLERSGEG